MALLPLSPDELLGTTRAVRFRLDLDRPVERETIEECLHLATQAPTSTNQQHWHFVVVTDPDVRTRLAGLYRRAWSDYAGADPSEPGASDVPGQRSSRYLAQNLHRVPVHVIPCVDGRPEGMPASELAALYGSIVQAGWSLQLAARARGLGGVWTTYHLDYEREAADVLGIPFDAVTQVALLPLAYTRGTDFQPGARRPLADVVHWDRW